MRVADLHCDTVMRIQSGMDITVANPAVQVDIPRLRAGDVGLQAFAAFESPDVAPGKRMHDATAKLDAIRELCEQNPGHLALAGDADSAARIAATDRTGVLLTVENGQAIEDNLENLEALRSRGVRMMTLVHMRNSNWVASCTGDQCEFDGLSEFGERVVDAMSSMGMIVDVSHSHETAFWKVARRTRRSGMPFIASHSNAWALCPHARNLKDDQIREIADQGGVIGINFFPLFLDGGHFAASKQRMGPVLAAAAKEDQHHHREPDSHDAMFQTLCGDYRRRMADMPVTSESILMHIDHIVNVAGVDCVAFGSDFDGILATPEDVTGSDAYPRILSLLSERGYSDADLEKIAWGNFMRVLRAHD